VCLSCDCPEAAIGTPSSPPEQSGLPDSRGIFLTPGQRSPLTAAYLFILSENSYTPRASRPCQTVRDRPKVTANALPWGAWRTTGIAVRVSPLQCNVSGVGGVRER